MKTILVITPYLPYEDVGHAGGKAIYDFIAWLKKRGLKVLLISFAWPHETGKFECLCRLCDDACFLVFEPAFTDRLLNSFQLNPVLVFPKMLARSFKHFIMRSRLNSETQSMIRRHDPDVVQVEYSTMVLYLNTIKSKKLRILHLHDVMMKPYERIYALETNPLTRVFRFLFYTVVKRLELSFCRSFDRVLVKSEYDKALLFQRGKLDAQVFPLGIEPISGIVPYQNREQGSVLFLGAMYRETNEKAALYFIERVMPLLQHRLGPVKFYIVGSSPSDRLRTLVSGNVVVTGFVQDVAAFYRRCQVFVAPLFVGGGMIFKILQAMSYGLPVVSTTVANEGILARDRQEILLADTAEKFAAEIASLMRDKALWDRVSVEGQKFVNAKYSWDLVIDEYLKKLDS